METYLGCASFPLSTFLIFSNFSSHFWIENCEMSSISKLFPVFVVAVSAARYAVAPPPQFTGPQSGIGSWFQTDAASSYTNGRSWCGYSYSDTEPLFAPVIRPLVPPMSFLLYPTSSTPPFLRRRSSTIRIRVFCMLMKDEHSLWL